MDNEVIPALFMEEVVACDTVHMLVMVETFCEDRALCVVAQVSVYGNVVRCVAFASVCRGGSLAFATSASLFGPLHVGLLHMVDDCEVMHGR